MTTGEIEMSATNKEVEKQEEEEEPQEPQEFKWYLQHEKTYKIVSTRWGVFTVLCGVIYLYHFVWTVAGVTQFCDITRLNVCGAEANAQQPRWDQAQQNIVDARALITDLNQQIEAETDQAQKNNLQAQVDAQNEIIATNKQTQVEIGEIASSVLDTAIALCAVFHMIEWLRQTVMLTTALVNVNLVPVFYAASINVPFGFIVMLVGIITVFSADGADCNQDGKQVERARYLTYQLICIFLYIPMMFAHVILFKIMGVEWLHAEYLRDPDEDDDEEEGGDDKEEKKD